ncbi:uncharacterized protein LOC127830978 isoform X3 [Dreissena polymorpha]|uniref:uncharacterized protein LOC127830978 isoform X3 n=1 Tax=Dreissena polymorpha TaxID=45954 RepID=UPI002264FD04|nr:uncharacterized protein LOC127830978 isoform X3 [Dreissena polymorpha]
MTDKIIARPGNFEHVTKMSRVDQGFAQPKSSPKPLFRQLPIKLYEVHSEPKPDFIRAEMKLGRNMRAAPKGSIPMNPPNPQALIEMLNRNHLKSDTPPSRQHDVQSNHAKHSYTDENRMFAAPREIQSQTRDLPMEPHEGSKPEPFNARANISETERERIIDAKRRELDYGFRSSLLTQITTQAEINCPPKEITPSKAIPAVSAEPTLTPPPPINLYNSYKMKDGPSSGGDNTGQNSSASNERKPNETSRLKNIAENAEEIADDLEAGPRSDDDDDGTFNF